ncbi:pyridoxal phosphate-dependent aminotransferase [Streptomyces qinglanensis]|uniref:pyridoxal phosphate-dependent aminotransferase n=1 Tax=Streptomyces qinglanensis TaxID=943816 RepID=UPI0037B78DDF
MQDPLDIIGDSSLPNPYEDASLLLNHQAAGGDPADVLYLSLGESWGHTAPGLRDTLAAPLPRHCHGYMLSPYGLPALRRVLRTYLTADHDLAGVAALGSDYDVAVSQNSTRNAMFHFGRLLREEAACEEAEAVVVTSAPGWDYAGVFTALGWSTRSFALVPERHYQPDPQEVAALLREARRDTSGPLLLVVNAQHNPTGANWSPHAVRAMVRAALEVGACLLVDDAYYAVHDPEVTPTNALRILLEELAGTPHARRPRWLAVRSLGKQFHCNGWGIGALTASPGTLTRLLAHALPQYSYVSAVPLQAAMADWLRNPASGRYLAQQRADGAVKRTEISRRLIRDLGYPGSGFFPGQCAAYLLLAVPPWYRNTPGPGKESYRRLCLSRAGVLLGESRMTTPGCAPDHAQEHVRLYTGPPLPVLTQALDRLCTAGLTWHGAPGEKRLAEFPGRTGGGGHA